VGIVVFGETVAMSDVTQILSRIESGDPTASEQLLPLVYEELRRLAAQRLAQEKPGQTLQATALVHEAYLRLVDGDGTEHWSSRGHFFAAAAEAMRRVLVERARHKKRLKHGGSAQRVDADLHRIPAPENPDEVLAVHEALDELHRHDAQIATLIKLRYFAGMTHAEAAEALGVTRRVADRLWAIGRTWLHQKLTES
jgi:RNA polymerase sigma factor (TIGR02999 family)